MNEHWLQPGPETPFVHGPAIESGGPLLAWLAAQSEGGRPATLLLPMRVAVDSVGTVRSATLATPREQPAIPVRLDDTALGIALGDRLRSAGGSGEVREAWLEGRWQAGPPATFAVTRWVRALGADEIAQPHFARRAVDPTADRGLLRALECLGQPVPAADKAAACDLLVSGGTAAIPLLIASLDDDRPYAVVDATNRQNQPPFVNPASSPVVRTVGTRVGMLLHRLVTPPPSEEFDFRGKVLSEQVLAIPDWRAFWARRSGRTLAEIHRELVPLVNAYWRQGGKTQRVDGS